MPVTGDVKVTGESSMLENADNTARVGYDNQRGRYFFYNNTLDREPLVKTDQAALDALKAEAGEVLANVLGAEARNFEFANVETDSLKLKGDDPGVLIKESFRFTRKLDGRHIVDNTAYFTVSFAGDQKVCSFEYVNPILEPAQLDLMVKPDATRTRLVQWAADKATAMSSAGQAIAVNVVTAQKAFDTYLSMNQGNGKVLVPHVSFWSKFDLANKDSYSCFVHLCMDASRTPKLDRNMIESTGR